MSKIPQSLFFEARKKVNGLPLPFSSNIFVTKCLKPIQNIRRDVSGYVLIVLMYIFFVLQISWRIKIIFEKIKVRIIEISWISIGDIRKTR